MNRIRASIVTFRTDPDELRRCLDSLRSGTIEDITIVDNSPTDSLSDFCREEDVNYIFTGKNLGYGAAHNIALRDSLANDAVDYHLVINSDVYFTSDVIPKIADHLDKNPDIGQLIPNTIYPSGKEQAVVRMLPTPFDLFARRFFPSFISQRRDRKYLLEFWDHKREANVPYHQGSFMFLRTDALRVAGLFDERFFMYPEDIDLTRRIHRSFRTVFWPEVTIVHAHRAASYKSLRMLWIHTANMVKYFNKWGWFFDRERRDLNCRLLKNLGYNKKTGV